MEIIPQPQSISSSALSAPLVTPVWGGGVVQGRIVEEGVRRVFERRVTWSRHFFRLLGGWSNTEEVVRQLRAGRVDLLRFADDLGTTWEISFADFLAHAEQKQYADLQYICSLHFWSRFGAEQLGLGLDGAASEVVHGAV